MSISKTLFIGIDPSGSKKPYGFAVLDDSARVTDLGEGELEDVLTLLRGQEAAIVAVCSPQRPNQGIVRAQMEKLGQAASHLRGADMRVGELELRRRGIAIAATPGRYDMCPSWIQAGFGLYQSMVEMGYKPHSSKAFPRQFMETHPHAVYCALLGQVPFPKPTLEGRLQRQLTLYECGLGIKDPMNFFEEITRHRMLKGFLPIEMIHTAEQLDVLAAAFTAYLAVTKPEETSFTGSASEGRIVLPVGKLKERY